MIHDAINILPLVADRLVADERQLCADNAASHQDKSNDNSEVLGGQNEKASPSRSAVGDPSIGDGGVALSVDDSWLDSALEGAVKWHHRVVLAR